jgi:hypothetical protein
MKIGSARVFYCAQRKSDSSVNQIEKKFEKFKSKLNSVTVPEFRIGRQV